MENTEAFVSSTVPLTWHDFLERMRQPSATEFVKAIKSFIVSFSNNPADPERDSAAVQEFLGNMETAFRVHPLWAGRSEEELDSAGEGLEKYIMTKLFPRVFASHPNDIKVDDELYEKLALIQQFIRPEHLDIQPTYQNETSWLLAQKELQKINLYKAPRDKLVCILSCCKVISNLLFNASVSANQNPPGADEFLPVLIYVTIKANPPQLHSNLMYIQRYRRESRLVGEAAYFFTNMLSAESFILNIDGKSLSMDETEFQKNMESAQSLIYGLAGDYDGQSQSDQSQTAPNSIEPKHSVEVQSTNEGTNAKDSQQQAYETPSVSDLESKGAAMLTGEDNVSQEFRNFRYLYSQVGDLTVGDVEDLLNNYKQLVVKYVCLAKGLGVPAPSPQSSESDAPEDKGRSLGAPAPAPPLPETQGHEESSDAWEDKGAAELDRDDHVDGGGIEGGRNGGTRVSTLESALAGEVVDQVDGKDDK